MLECKNRFVTMKSCCQFSPPSQTCCSVAWPFRQGFESVHEDGEGSFKMFMESKYCEKMPHSLLLAGCLGPVATCYICMCGCISLMEFLSRLRAMAVIRHFPGIFPITFVLLNQIRRGSLAVQQRNRLFLLTKKNSAGFYFRLNKTKPRSRGEGGNPSLQKKEKLQ